MRNFLIIIIIAFIANLVFLSIGYSQNNINIQAIVPETEHNRNLTPAQPVIKKNEASFKENKYLYFFQKFEEQEDEKYDQQTWHDKVVSYGFLISFLIICAILFVSLLHLFDKYMINHKLHNEKK